MALTFGSLFSGIGGFDLGLERAGMECAWQVEIDKQCRQVLKRHWPGVNQYEDVTKIGADNLEPTDLVCGGFPCQGLSVAGRRAGLAGERSGLWWEFHRILGERLPRWVVVENVPGIRSGCGCTDCRAVGRILRIHEWKRRRSGGEPCAVCLAGRRMLESHSGRNLAIVLHGLAQLGYWWAYRSLDSQCFGVAQRRRRVFIVGRAGGVCPPEVLFEPESVSGDSPPSREAGEGVAGTLEARADAGGFPGTDGACAGHVVAGTLQAHSAKHGHAMTTQQAAESGHEVAKTVTTGTGKRYDPETETIVAFSVNQRREGRLREVHGSITEPSGTQVDGVLALQGAGETSQGSQGSEWKRDQSFTLNLVDTHGVAGGGVIPRRLTPRECERLQGFPDDWTRYGATEDGDRIELADSPRYRMLGNAVTVSVAEWIGRKIVEADKKE